MAHRKKHYRMTPIQKLNCKIVSLKTKILLEIINSEVEGEYDPIEKQMAMEELERRDLNKKITEL